MGRIIGLTGIERECAEGFIEATRTLIADVDIDPYVDGLKESDFDAIIRTSFKEVNETFAVPHYMSYEDGWRLLESLKQPI